MIHSDAPLIENNRRGEKMKGDVKDSDKRLMFIQQKLYRGMAMGGNL